MGNSTGSMFYFFIIIIAIYIVGVGIYSLVQWLKKKKEHENDEAFKRGDE